MIVLRSFTPLLFLLFPFALATKLDQAGLSVETVRRAEDSAWPVEAVHGTDTVRLLDETAAPTEVPTESPAPSPSPSPAPTSFPTVTSEPTATPTESPTESPAPSPSPSPAPTQIPTKEPSANPTGSPTVTPMPSPSPSGQPSSTPSDIPTPAPTGEPTVSQAPSSTPTKSIQPSANPSEVPTPKPTGTPSSSPTKSPTVSPSAEPSSFPSGAPSPAPTEEAVKTKVATSFILLEAIDEKMMEVEIGRFEIRTLEFIRGAFSREYITDFEVDIITGVVLTQTLHDGSTDAATDGGNDRKLQTKTGLEVLFRTVAVVTNGVASEGFVFQDLVDEAFAAYFDIYLNELSEEGAFFAPLFIQTKAEKGSSAQFILALIVSAVAFLIAVGASYYAIRKHLESKKRKKPPPMLALSDRKYATASSSSDSSDKDNANSNLRLVIDDDGDDDDEFNDVRLSPAVLSAMSSVMSRSDESRPKRNKSLPLSPNTLEKGGARPPLDDLYSEAPPSKKWLTPRKFFKGAFETSSSPGGRSDPPNHPDDLNYDEGRRKSFEPSARKAATTEQPRRLSDANANKEKKNHSKPPRRPSSVATPLGSAVSGFFAKAGSALGLGKKNAASEPGASKPGLSEAVRPTLSKHHSEGIPQKNTIIAYYRDGSEAGQSDFSRAKEAESDYYNPSEFMGSEAQTDYDVNYSEAGYDVNYSEAGDSEHTESDRSRSSRKKRFDDTISLDEQSQDRERNKRSKSQDQEWWNDDREVQPERATNVQPKLQETIGGNLGARPFPASSQERNDDKESFFSSGMNTPSRAPSSVGARSSQPSPASSVYHQYPTLPTQQQDTTRRAFDYDRGNTFSDRGNAFSLGARPLEDTEVKQFKATSSLEAMAKRAGVYDVFAPSGPIGIVVDTGNEGPAVHSLKSTSPMLGLINPGDLIIALDDEDTRNMTAASLTRLMAKKSRAKERKITLLAIEIF